MLAPMSDARFFHALARLMRAHAAAMRAGDRAASLSFLLKGPGSEHLAAPLTPEVSLADAVRLLIGDAGPVEAMQFLSRLPEEIVNSSPYEAALADAIADRAAVLAKG